MSNRFTGTLFALGVALIWGLTSVTLYFGLQNLGLARTSASDAGLVSGSVPAITTLLSALTRGERISPLR